MIHTSSAVGNPGQLVPRPIHSLEEPLWTTTLHDQNKLSSEKCSTCGVMCVVNSEYSGSTCEADLMEEKYERWA